MTAAMKPYTIALNDEWTADESFVRTDNVLHHLNLITAIEDSHTDSVKDNQRRDADKEYTDAKTDFLCEIGSRARF